MIKERPIMLSTKAVRAILFEKKTQLRCIVSPQPECDPTSGFWYPDYISDARRHYASEKHLKKGMPKDFFKFGKIGDKLWVKESFVKKTIPPSLNKHVFGDPPCESDYIYKADLLDCQLGKIKWQSPIYLPKEGSRIALEIVNIGVERLNEISEKDATAEGFARFTRDCKKPKFKALWESTHGKGSWDKNPLVWKLEFKLSDLKYADKTGE